MADMDLREVGSRVYVQLLPTERENISIAVKASLVAMVKDASLYLPIYKYMHVVPT